jgi:hypothetical protein
MTDKQRVCSTYHLPQDPRQFAATPKARTAALGIVAACRACGEPGRGGGGGAAGGVVVIARPVTVPGSVVPRRCPAWQPRHNHYPPPVWASPFATSLHVQVYQPPFSQCTTPLSRLPGPLAWQRGKHLMPVYPGLPDSRPVYQACVPVCCRANSRAGPQCTHRSQNKAARMARAAAKQQQAAPGALHATRAVLAAMGLLIMLSGACSASLAVESPREFQKPRALQRNRPASWRRAECSARPASPHIASVIR